MIDHILIHGTIHTMEEEETHSALAIAGDRIFAVGTDEEILSLKEEDTVCTDLLGKTVLPGFIDSHCHLMGTALNEDRIDLRGADSLAEIVRRGRAFLAERKIPAGEWILGEGYNQNLFAEPSLPDKTTCDAISTEHPILLERVCGHIAAANELALSAVGFDETTVIPGGLLPKDENGKPNGIVTEQALDEMKLRMPKISREHMKENLVRTMKKWNSYGLTSVHSDDSEWASPAEVCELYWELEEEGKLSLRVFEEFHAPHPDDLDEFLSMGVRTRDGSEFFRVGNIKLMTDGSLGARTASLREPYTDDPDTKGIAVYSQEELDTLITTAHAEGMQVACHAIGDGAIEQCIRAMAKAHAESGSNTLRDRIVHCQLPDRDQLKRIAEEKICLDIQPPFVPTDLSIVHARIGDRDRDSYAWKTMEELGIVTAGSSDSPVETAAPLWGIAAAVRRTDPCGEPAGGWHPTEKLSRKEAIRLYTARGAYLSFEEEVKGTIAPGKKADLVVLSEDPFTAAEEKIAKIRVEAVFLGGNRLEY